jgi:hypothetical protein
MNNCVIKEVAFEVVKMQTGLGMVITSGSQHGIVWGTKIHIPSVAPEELTQLGNMFLEAAQQEQQKKK